MLPKLSTNFYNPPGMLARVLLEGDRLLLASKLGDWGWTLIKPTKEEEGYWRHSSGNKVLAGAGTWELLRADGSLERVKSLQELFQLLRQTPPNEHGDHLTDLA